MKVCYIFRKPGIYGQSIEKTFKLVMPGITCDYGTEYLPCGRADFISILKNLWYCRKIVKRNEYDIFHITGDTNYIAIVLPRKKSVISIHDFGLVMESHGIKKVIALLFWFFIPLHRCSMITANSKKTYEEMLIYMPHYKKEVTIIPPPIPDDYIENGVSKFDSNRPIILQVGTKERKNLSRIIKATQGMNCELRIIGKLNESQLKLLKECKTYYTNDFDISDEQMKHEYMNCSIVTFISTFEGFGIPVVEAQAMGKVVISSNIEPMKTVAGIGACLVDPFNEVSIRETIQKVINDSDYRMSIIQNGLKNAEKYRAKYISKQYDRIYQQILL